MSRKHTIAKAPRLPFDEILSQAGTNHNQASVGDGPWDNDSVLDIHEPEFPSDLPTFEEDPFSYLDQIGLLVEDETILFEPEPPPVTLSDENNQMLCVFIPFGSSSVTFPLLTVSQYLF